MEHVIEINWDEDAGVWYAINYSIPLALEGSSFDALIEKVKVAALELLELNGGIVTPVQLCFKGTRREYIA
jgi:hypothetical protein